jgi:hypothetical protein
VVVDGEIGEWGLRDWQPIFSESKIRGKKVKIGKYKAVWIPDDGTLFMAARMDSISVDRCRLHITTHDPLAYNGFTYVAGQTYFTGSGDSRLGSIEYAVGTKGLTCEWMVPKDFTFPGPRLANVGDVVGLGVSYSGKFAVERWSSPQAEEARIDYLLGHTADAVLVRSTVSARYVIRAINNKVLPTVRNWDIELPVSTEIMGMGLLLLCVVGVISGVLYRTARERKGDYSFLFLFTTFSFLSREVISLDIPYGMLKDPIVGITFFLTSVFAILLMVSKANAELGTWDNIRTRCFGKLPFRFQRHFIRVFGKFLHGASHWFFILFVVGKISKAINPVELRHLPGVEFLAPFVPAFLTCVLYRVEANPRAAALRGAVLLIFIFVASVPEGVVVGWLDGSNPWPVLVLLASLGAILAPLYTYKRRPDGWYLLTLAGLVYGGAAIYNNLYLMGEVPLSDWVFLLGPVGLVFGTVPVIWRRFTLSRKEEVRREEELMQARRIQLSMLPSIVPELPTVDIGWKMETATEVGGDYYDYILQEDGQVTVVLGDATGHGMQAGTVVTASKSLVQSLSGKLPIEDSLKIMSRALKGMNLNRLGMAMVMARLQNSTLSLSSAGIPPVLIFRVSSGEVEEVLLQGFPLGYVATPNYETYSTTLTVGDTILMMSDGFPERMNPQGEQLGYERSQESFRRVATLPPDEICRKLAQVGEDWAGGGVPEDDVSFVVIRAKESGKS